MDPEELSSAEATAPEEIEAPAAELPQSAPSSIQRTPIGAARQSLAESRDLNAQAAVTGLENIAKTDAKAAQALQSEETALKDLQTRQNAVFAEADQAKAQLADVQAKRLEYRQRVQSQLNLMDSKAKQIAAGEIHAPWANAATPLKIGALIATSLGAAVQAFYGDRTNVVADQIDAAIKNDIGMQRLKLEKNRDDYAMQGNLLHTMMGVSDHLEDASNKAYVTAIEGVRGRIEALKSLVTDPRIQANLDKMSVELDMKSAKAKQDLLQFTVGQDVRLSQAEATLAAKTEVTGLEAQKAETARENMRIRQEQLGIRRAGLGLREEQHAEQQAEKTVPGWEPANPSSPPPFTTGEAKELRDTMSTAHQVDQALENYAAQLDKGIPLSLAQLRQIQQAAAKATLIVKGKEVFNMGAALSGIEQKLIERGFLTSDGTKWLNPRGAAQLVRQALDAALGDMETKFRSRGLRPSKNNPLFGE